MRRVGLGLRSLGPGIVFAVTVLGAGTIVTNAAAGASSGYALLWVLAIAIVFRYVWLAASARYVLVSGETLIAGYARFGPWFLWGLWFALLLMGHLYSLYSIALLGFTFDLLVPLPWAHAPDAWALLFTLAGFGMCFWGGYPVIESVCKGLLVLLAGALIVVAAAAGPDPGGIARGIFVPGAPAGEVFAGTVSIVVALVGSEVGSVTNVAYGYFLYEKGWRQPADLPRQRRDLRFSLIATFVMAALLQIVAAATLFESGVEVDSAYALVGIFSDRLGRVGLAIFAVGLWAATFTTFVGANTGYAATFSDVTRRLVPGANLPYATSDERITVGRDPVYRGAIAFWALSPLYVLVTDWDAAFLALLVNSIVVFLVPFLCYGLLRLSASEARLGEHRNGFLTNLAFVLMILVTSYMTGMTLVSWVR